MRISLFFLSSAGVPPETNHRMIISVHSAAEIFFIIFNSLSDANRQDEALRLFLWAQHDVLAGKCEFDVY